MMRTALLVLAIAACGKSGGESGTAATGSAPAAPAAASNDLTGEWSGSWKRDQIAGGGELHLSVGAKTTFKRVGTACPPEETPATVTVTGNTVKIEVATDEVKATYTGTRNGKEITGELTTTCKLGTGTGKWKLTAQ